MSDGSEYVSNHDRGAFGKLLAEARELGAVSLEFFVGLNYTLSLHDALPIYGRASCRERVYGVAAYVF